jgi:hypothetical protein
VHFAKAIAPALDFQGSGSSTVKPSAMRISCRSSRGIPKWAAAVFSGLFGVRSLDAALSFVRRTPEAAPQPIGEHNGQRRLAGPFQSWPFILLSGFLGFCLSFGVLNAGAGAEAGSGPQATQSALKAGWVFNFLKSTDWPQDATNNSAPYVLGIFGEDPFGEDLRKKFAQQKVKNRSITIKRCSVDEAKVCHVVFISASDKDKLTEILGALQDSSVLTIGDTDEFARLGGIIGLTIGKEQAFEINHAAYKRSKLNIDSRVLVCGKLLR